MREFPEPSQKEKTPAIWTYFGITYADWELLKLNQGFVIKDANVIDTQARSYPLGDAQIIWKPLRQYTNVPTIVSSVIGSLAGIRAIASEAMRKNAGNLDRRGFLRSIFVGAPLGATTGAYAIPYATEKIVRNSELGRIDPARAMQGLSHPLNVKAYFEETINEIAEANTAKAEVLHETEGYAIETRNIRHMYGTDQLYTLRPNKTHRVSLSLHTAAGLPSDPGSVTIGGDITEFAKKLTQNKFDDFTILGLMKSPYTTRITNREFKYTHTVPTAISLAIDGAPVAFTSASWTHPFAISYADSAELNVNSLHAWLGLASKTGVWSPDFIRHWGREQGLMQLTYSLPLLKEKFTQEGWTEAAPGHPAHQRILAFSDGKVTVLPDEQAWDELEFAARRNPADLMKKSYVKPGSIIDLEQDKPLTPRPGGVINGMSVNGLVLDNSGELLSMITMNQDTRVKSPLLMDIVKQTEPNARYYVGTDEHGGGGILHVPDDKDL